MAFYSTIPELAAGELAWADLQTCFNANSSGPS
jgi:hypothetical protein